MVTIYFSPAAKQSQLDDVRALLAKNRKVKEFGFVSRRLALRREARKFPRLVKNLLVNPLPASYEVVAKAVTDVAPIESDFPVGISAVAKVSASGSC